MRVAVINLSGEMSGGYRKYLHRVVPLIRRRPEVSDLRLFIPDALVTAVNEETATRETFSARDAWRGFPELRAKIRGYRPDVVFVPTARVVPGLGCPLVVMVRNMEPLEAPLGPNPLRERIRVVARAASTYLACRLATRVIAVSEHVASFLDHSWGLARDKIGVVYHGVDALPPGPVPASLGELPERSFLFTAGSIRPARGLEDLVRALGAASTRGIRPRVVIAGATDPGMDAHRRSLERLAEDQGVHGQIVWAGALSSDEMAWCFRSCRAFVMTSRAEACPNTVLEALAYGCLSISTDHAPMPEFFADAARYYRERVAQSLADQIVQIDLLAPAEEAALRSRATRRALGYRWESTALETVNQLLQATRP